MAEPAKAVPNAHAPPPRRLAFTFDASTGEIVKAENVDSGGQRRELSKADKLDLAKEHPGAGVDTLVERAFEAGIASLLDEEDRKEEESETEDEAGVRRILLKPLMAGTYAIRAARREVLRKAIVQTLIRDVLGSEDSESEPPKSKKSDRAAPKTVN